MNKSFFKIFFCVKCVPAYVQTYNQYFLYTIFNNIIFYYSYIIYILYLINFCYNNIIYYICNKIFISFVYIKIKIDFLIIYYKF